MTGRPIATVATNEADLELHAALSGRVIAQLSSLAGAPMMREGRLVPLLTRHVTDHLRQYACYGSRKAQPVRVRWFMDLSVERPGSNQNVLSPKELTSAEAKGRGRLRG